MNTVHFIPVFLSVVIFAYWATRKPQLQRDDGAAILGSGPFFDSIASYYDVTNKMMSIGMDMNWRKELVKHLQLQSTDVVLDLATGTGDVALLIASELGQLNSHHRKVQALDPSKNMLLNGAIKATKASLNENIEFILGDVEKMTFADETFDKITMSFGIRNVLNKGNAVNEIYRITKPNGTVAIMEFVTPRRGLLAPFARGFIAYILPIIGSISSGGFTIEYTHLRDSIFNFPSPEEFRGTLLSTGFSHCEAIDIAFDVVMIFKCMK